MRRKKSETHLKKNQPESNMPEFKHNGKSYNNGVELALDLIRGKWKMPILWRIKEKPKRYGEIKRSLPRTSHKMLAQQLQELEKEGFIKRKVFPTVPPAVEYSITAKGQQTIPVIEALRDFGEKIREGGNRKGTDEKKT